MCSIQDAHACCYDVRTLLSSTSKLMDGKKLTDLKLPIIAALVEKRVLQKASGTVIGALLQKYNLV